jgi:hypothetical protein
MSKGSISKFKQSSLDSKLHLDVNYKKLLDEIKTRLKKAQLRAAISVNNELIQFYWEIGTLISRWRLIDSRNFLLIWRFLTSDKLPHVESKYRCVSRTLYSFI